MLDYRLLTEKLGNASAPDRELDAELLAWLFSENYNRLHHDRPESFRWSFVQMSPVLEGAHTRGNGPDAVSAIALWRGREAAPIASVEVPEVTASIDLAAQLVKREFPSSSWTIRHSPSGVPAEYVGSIAPAGGAEPVVGGSNHAPIALLIALVQARGSGAAN